MCCTLVGGLSRHKTHGSTSTEPSQAAPIRCVVLGRSTDLRRGYSVFVLQLHVRTRGVEGLG
jgi:hypothetical protein